MLETSEKLELLELAKDASWVPHREGLGVYDVDKWIETYKALRDIVDDSGTQKSLHPRPAMQD